MNGIFRNIFSLIILSMIIGAVSAAENGAVTSNGWNADTNKINIRIEDPDKMGAFFLSSSSGPIITGSVMCSGNAYQDEFMVDYMNFPLTFAFVDCQYNVEFWRIDRNGTTNRISGSEGNGIVTSDWTLIPGQMNIRIEDPDIEGPRETSTVAVSNLGGGSAWGTSCIGTYQRNYGPYGLYEPSLDPILFPVILMYDDCQANLEVWKIDTDETTTRIGSVTTLSETSCGNTPAGQNINIIPTSNVNIKFDSVNSCGNTMTTTYNNNQWSPLPDNHQGISFNDIQTTATYSNSITVNIAYSDADISNMDENSLKMFHYENGNWIDVTTSLDTASNKVSGSVNSLSPFSIAGISSGSTTPTVGPTVSPISGNIVRGSSFDIIGILILSLCLVIISLSRLRTKKK